MDLELNNTPLEEIEEIEELEELTDIQPLENADVQAEEISELEEVDEISEIPQRATESENADTFIFFKSDSKIYAIKSENVIEILRNTEIYPLPFVPSYIAGLVNYHGVPHAVVDFSSLLEEKNVASNSGPLLVLSSDAHFCLKVDEVIRLAKASARIIEEKNELLKKDYLTGVVNTQEHTALLLDTKLLEQKIKIKLKDM